MSTGFLQTEGSEEDWEQLIDSIADILGKRPVARLTLR